MIKKVEGLPRGRNSNTPKVTPRSYETADLSTKEKTKRSGSDFSGKMKTK